MSMRWKARTTGSSWPIVSTNVISPTTHPEVVPELADVETHDVDGELTYIAHLSTLTAKEKANELGTSSIQYFPNISLSVL